MLDRPLDQLAASDIRRLVEDRVGERRTLDYKESLHLNTDREKKEFLADVSSFANAGGGHLVLGVAELRDGSGQPTGVAGAVPGLRNWSSGLQATIEHLVRDGIEPRLPIEIGVVESTGDDDHPVVVIRIRRSWNAPHIVRLGGGSRFYSRNSHGKQQLDVTEIRRAFALSESLMSRVRSFRDERIGRVLGGEGREAEPRAPLLALHLIPLGTFATEELIDARVLAETWARALPSKGSPAFNLDGVLIASRSDGTTYRLFRRGAVEATWLLRVHEDTLHGGRGVSGLEVECEVVEGVLTFRRVWRELSIAPPILVFVTVIGLGGLHLGRPRLRLEGRTYESWSSERTFDRDVVPLPELMVAELAESKAEVAKSLRPIFDVFWQAGGARGSQCFDSQGEWQAEG